MLEFKEKHPSVQLSFCIKHDLYDFDDRPFYIYEIFRTPNFVGPNSCTIFLPDFYSYAYHFFYLCDSVELYSIMQFRLHIIVAEKLPYVNVTSIVATYIVSELCIHWRMFWRAAFSKDRYTLNKLYRKRKKKYFGKKIFLYD